MTGRSHRSENSSGVVNNRADVNLCYSPLEHNIEEKNQNPTLSKKYIQVDSMLKTLMWPGVSDTRL